MLNKIKLKVQIIRDQYRGKLRFVAFVGVTIFFLSIFDSIMSYIVPVLMTDTGFTEFQMGLLYSSSSVFGLILDFILAKMFKNSTYTSGFFMTSMLGILFPLLMFVNPTFITFLIGMFIWGLYYNLWGFARSDFIARESKVAFHVAGATILMAFHDIGYLTGTLSAQPLLDKLNYHQLLQVILPIIFISIIFQIPGLLKRKKVALKSDAEVQNTISNLEELHRIKLVGKRLLPILILGVTISTIEAITWTITPIIDKVMPALNDLGGIILALNFLPSLIAYSLAIKLTVKFGKKKVMIVTFILAEIVLSMLGFATNAPTYLLLTFISSFIVSISYSSYAGVIADYLNESKTYDSEIMSTNDMSTNLGYIIGPILGGFLLTTFESTALFTYVGAVGVIIGIIVMFITPRKIPFYDKDISVTD